MNACPSDLALDDRQIHGRAAPAEEAAHVAACPSCQARLVARAARVAEFEAELAPLTWARIVAERRARPRRVAPRLLLRLLVAAGAAASLVLLVGPDRRAARPGVTPKGSALVEIVCRRGSRTFVLGPGEEVAPGDALRFLPLPAPGWLEARYVQVGSVDGTGTYAPFYPSSEDGASVALPVAGAPLEGSIRLDDAPGPERLFVVLSAAPLSARDVARAALAHAAAADRLDRVGGQKVVSAWMILPKRGGGPASAP